MPVVNTIPPSLTEQDIKRFWGWVDKSPGQGPKGECWTWTRGTSVGYGTFHIPKRTLSAHRVSFFLWGGKWPVLFICHKCDWRLCVNPFHLFEGSQAANMRDMAQKGRGARGTMQPHSKLTEAQVLQIRAIYAGGNRTQQSIADQFGVAFQTANDIINRKKWKHI